MNGDGKADLIAFSSTDVNVMLSEGSTFASPLPAFGDATFSNSDGFNSFDDHPRMIGDFDGDGLNDIVGFSSSGIKIAFNNLVCSHATRDPSV